MLTKATEFRGNPVDCRRNAVQAVNSFDRQYWLDVGAHWTKMAMAEEIADGGRLFQSQRNENRRGRLGLKVLPLTVIRSARISSFSTVDG